MLSRNQIWTDQNRPKTLCLIKELCKQGIDDPIFTVRDEKEGYISLQKLYVEHTINDPSEAEFADLVFGDFIYWMHLRETPKFKPFVEEWRLIADAKRKSKAFKAIVREVEEEGKASFSAAKFLIDEPWKDKRNPKTKAQSKETTEKAYSGFDDDIKRLREEGFIQ